MGWRRTSSSTSHLLNGRLSVLTVMQPEEEEKKWTIISAKLQSKAFSARLCVEVPIRSPQVVTKKAVSHHHEEEETASWRTGDEPWGSNGDILKPKEQHRRLFFPLKGKEVSDLVRTRLAAFSTHIYVTPRTKIGSVGSVGSVTKWNSWRWKILTGNWINKRFVHHLWEFQGHPQPPQSWSQWHPGGPVTSI